MRLPRSAVIALALVAAGCGGGDEPRDSVKRYIERANGVQQRYTEPFEEANLAYRGFAEGSLDGREAVAELLRAEEAVRRARDELAALTPPDEARPLHSRLVRLVDMNLAFAHETAVLAAYQRGAGVALAPLAAADRRLQLALDAADDPAQQVRALERFGARVRAALERLGTLEVPPVLRPQHVDQVHRLAATRRLTVRLRAALRAEDAQAVARHLRRFRETAGRRRPDRALAERAIEQYTRRYRRLQDAYADLYRSQAQLDRALG